MKNGLLLDPPEVGRQRAVVLCGDIALHRKLLSDSASRVAGLTILRCAEDRDKLFSVLHQLNSAILVLRQNFIEQLPEGTVLQLTNFGKNCKVLGVLESDALETPSATQMLRLGCRGVLPQRFSSKLFRRAVLAILRGELSAPIGIISELLCELLRTASLKTQNGLTPQEARILELSLQGHKNSAIADALFISLETVRWHKRRLNRKLRAPIEPRSPHTEEIPPARHLAAG